MAAPIPSATTHSPLPSPPFIYVEGVPNFRDLGGWPSTLTSPQSTEPLSVRRNLLFRSARPSNITAAGTSHLTKTLGVTTIYDLRSKAELHNFVATPSMLDIPGTTRIFVPVFEEQDWSLETLAVRSKDYTSADGTAGFVRAYAEILSSGVVSYRTIFEHIRDKPYEGMLVHCSAGKDRTGVLCALVLRLAGVSDEDIAREYSLTELGLLELREVISKTLKDDEQFRGLGKQEAERMLSARKENMMATLGMLDAKFGGAEGYLRDKLKFEPGEIRMIKENLVVEEPAVVGEDVGFSEQI